MFWLPLIQGILGASHNAQQEDENKKAQLASALSKKGPVQPQQVAPPSQIPNLGSMPGAQSEPAQRDGIIDPWAKDEQKQQGGGLIGGLISGILGGR